MAFIGKYLLQLSFIAGECHGIVNIGINTQPKDDSVIKPMRQTPIYDMEDTENLIF